MPVKAPDRHQWTLRFKNHKTTILLFATQNESFESIKERLLEAIKATGRSEINGMKVPAIADQIVFGVPIDSNDDSKGWIDLEIPELNGEDGKSSKKTNVLNSSPLGAGLKDGSVIAFKFRKEQSQDDDMDIDDTDWDVVMPTFEEAVADHEEDVEDEEDDDEEED
ncbi:MAG: hypothetical protein LQ342_000295 [Letrouitia transgressa]|nr:MAG: hypothetical protein LQ342_000295 [Letrouitia transgressa]